MRARPTRKRIHPTSQLDRQAELRNVIPPPAPAILPFIVMTPTTTVPRIFRIKAIFTHVVIALPSLYPA